MLGHGRAGGAGNQRCCSRDVEKACCVTTGTNAVDHPLGLDRNRGCKFAHNGGRPGQFFHRFTLDVQSRQGSTDLGRGGVAPHDGAHHLAHLVSTEILSQA